MNMRFTILRSLLFALATLLTLSHPAMADEICPVNFNDQMSRLHGILEYRPFGLEYLDSRDEHLVEMAIRESRQICSECSDKFGGAGCAMAAYFIEFRDQATPNRESVEEIQEFQSRGCDHGFAGACIELADWKDPYKFIGSFAEFTIRDFDEALTIYSRTCALGRDGNSYYNLFGEPAVACLRIAEAFQNGTGLQQDKLRALDYARRACEIDERACLYYNLISN